MNHKRLGKLVDEDSRSGRKIALEAGLDLGALYRLISGKNKTLFLDTAFKLADVLGVDVNEFRENDEE